MARKAMLIDLTRCIGCDACTVACKQENGTPVDVFFARVLNVEAGAYPHVKRLYIPVLCNHCEDPACLKACPNKAIFRREDGIVLIDQDRCRGTGACVSACPYGNIILTPRDTWYLPEDRAYERDYVKPRLKENVARKCTFCAQRVDNGLDPACVVACPTTARIFGDLDDPESRISLYIAQQKEQTARDPFKLLPEAGTDPANLYLGPMAAQETHTEGGAAEPPLTEPREESGEWRAEIPAAPEPPAPVPTGVARAAGKPLGVLLLVMLLLTACATAQTETALSQEEVWGASSCAGCHGQTAMGGFGPPLAQLKDSLKAYHDPDRFRKLVRDGKGMMPATPEKELSDAETAAIHQYVLQAPWDESQIPIAYKVGALLSGRNVGIAFSIIGALSLLLSLKVLLYWIQCAGWRQLRPYLRKFGYGRATWIALRALIVDGFLVASLWRKSKHRWAMHGLLLYGFCGLGLADMLMQTLNPTRAGLPLTHPLKLLPNLSGLMVLAGIVYVRYRYSKDPYIDNGLTLGRDYLFLNLLTITILSGFLVETLRYSGAIEWVLPTYVLHLGVVAILLISAPFTRFSHAFVVPALVAMTRVTEAITASGVDLGFSREPSPGRHHKSERIAAGVIRTVDPDFQGPIRLRYYP